MYNYYYRGGGQVGENRIFSGILATTLVQYRLQAGTFIYTLIMLVCTIGVNI